MHSWITFHRTLTNERILKVEKKENKTEESLGKTNDPSYPPVEKKGKIRWLKMATFNVYYDSWQTNPVDFDGSLTLTQILGNLKDLTTVSKSSLWGDGITKVVKEVVEEEDLPTPGIKKRSYRKLVEEAKNMIEFKNFRLKGIQTNTPKDPESKILSGKNDIICTQEDHDRLAKESQEQKEKLTVKPKSSRGDKTFCVKKGRFWLSDPCPNPLGRSINPGAPRSNQKWHEENRTILDRIIYPGKAFAPWSRKLRILGFIKRR